MSSGSFRSKSSVFSFDVSDLRTVTKHLQSSTVTLHLGILYTEYKGVGLKNMGF